MYLAGHGNSTSLQSCKFCVKCLDGRMIRQISCALLVLFLFSSCENRYRRGSSDSHSSSSVDSKFVGKTSDDAYQVSKSEYDDNFVSRYGLLYLKASQDPFTGRILTVDVGESGEFVSSDESWKEGKKHGKSSKWFSNGIKMYERNYNEGRWHGAVTRWWPNGQKMYVRAYSNGVRHGKEATWRSDGTALSLPADGTPKVIESEFSTGEIEHSLPNVNIEDPSPVSEPSVISDDIQLDPVEPAFEPTPTDDFQSVPVPSAQEDGFSDLPSFPPLEEEAPSSDGDLAFPEMPAESDDDLALPGLDAPALPADEPLPALPIETESDLPDLPGLDEPAPSNDDALPPLPGLPGDGDSGGLPPLPGLEDDAGGLPPLPGGNDEGFGDLPPLPPLP